MKYWICMKWWKGFRSGFFLLYSSECAKQNMHQNREIFNNSFFHDFSFLSWCQIQTSDVELINSVHLVSSLSQYYALQTRVPFAWIRANESFQPLACRIQNGWWRNYLFHSVSSHNSDSPFCVRLDWFLFSSPRTQIPRARSGTSRINSLFTSNLSNVLIWHPTIQMNILNHCCM
jgi:hypothetical protein